MSKTIKVALAGAGAFGIKHLDGIKNIDGVEVVSLIGREFDKTKACGGLSHVFFRVFEPIECYLLRAPMAVCPPVLRCPQAGHCHH